MGCADRVAFVKKKTAVNSTIDRTLGDAPGELSDETACVDR